MNTDEQAAREAGSQYGAMAADLSLVHISLAVSEDAIQEHIADLARNIREQAEWQAREGLGKDLAAVWKLLPLEQLRPAWRLRKSLRIEQS